MHTHLVRSRQARAGRRPAPYRRTPL